MEAVVIRDQSSILSVYNDHRSADSRRAWSDGASHAATPQEKARLVMGSDKGGSRVSVIGLGKIGTPLAVGFATRGHRVVGFDTDPSVLAQFAAGIVPLNEPGLADAFREAGDLFTTTPDIDAAVIATDISFVIVPSPSDATGQLSSRHAEDACERLGHALRRKDAYHIVVIGTTLMPTTTDRVLRPILERESGRSSVSDFGLCFVPEFCALGNALAGIFAPDMVVIGQSDDRAGATVEGLYAAFCKSGTPILRMSLVNAEIVKLGLNNFVALKIGFANMMARLCEKLPGANVDVVAGAMGLDRRIGGRCLSGATAFGGPCFPRDTRALAALTNGLKVDGAIAEAVGISNRGEISRLVSAVRTALAPGGHAGVLGLAYKPGTDIIDESVGMLVAHELARAGVPVSAFDPLAASRARAALPNSVSISPTLKSCLEESDVILISLPCDEFRRIEPPDLARSGPRPTIIDCWRILAPAAFAEVADVQSGGMGR